MIGVIVALCWLSVVCSIVYVATGALPVIVAAALAVGGAVALLVIRSELRRG